MEQNTKRNTVVIKTSETARSMWYVVPGSEGGVYHVRYDKLNDRWSCECKGYVFRADCSHIDKAKEYRSGKK